jgi:D-hexose-6-phosphate mutarotase
MITRSAFQSYTPSIPLFGQRKRNTYAHFGSAKAVPARIKSIDKNKESTSVSLSISKNSSINLQSKIRDKLKLANTPFLDVA